MNTKTKTKAPATTEAPTEALTEAPDEVTFSAKEVAAELGLDPKSFRRWLRAHTADRANKGGRWIFTTESKAAFIAAYNSKGAGTEPSLPDAD